MLQSQKVKKRVLKIKVYFDAVKEDAVENVRLSFYSYETKKMVADDIIETEFKRGDTTITYSKAIDFF